MANVEHIFGYKYYHGSGNNIRYTSAAVYCRILGNGDWILASVTTEDDYNAVVEFNRGKQAVN